MIDGVNDRMHVFLYMTVHTQTFPIHHEISYPPGLLFFDQRLTHSQINDELSSKRTSTNKFRVISISTWLIKRCDEQKIAILFELFVIHLHYMLATIELT